MSTMSLVDVSLCRAGVADRAVTGQVQALLKSRTFLESVVFSHLTPASCQVRANTVLLLAIGCECSPRTLGEQFSSALRWFDCAVTHALRKVHSRMLD